MCPELLTDTVNVRPCSLSSVQSFDELLLMKRGGRIIYFGPLGEHSRDLIQYFEVSLLYLDFCF